MNTAPDRDDLDEIAVERAVMGDPPASLTRAEREQAVRILHGRRLNDQQISERIGVHPDTICRIRGYLRLPAVGTPRTAGAAPPRRRHMAMVAEPPPVGRIEDMLARAKGATGPGSAGLHHYATRVEQAVERLGRAFTDQDKARQEAARIEGARKRVAKLKAELARAQAEVRGKPRATEKAAAAYAGQREVRAWADAHGIPVARRGRMPQAVIDAYRNAHPDTTARRTS